MTEACHRAKLNPILWEKMVDIWIPLMDGARSLREEIDQTSLWSKDDPSGFYETVWFKDIKTPEDGEKHCKDFMMPQNIRYHHKFEEEELRYIERIKGPEEARELAKIFNEIREDAKKWN